MRYATTFAFTLAFALSSLPCFASSGTTTENQPEVLIEFYDKYNEVKLGLTENSVFMIFSSQVREHMNRELSEQHSEDLQSFVDSGGEFIIGPPVVLHSNKLTYELKDIRDIKFDRGKLIFEYNYRSDIVFEDIISTNGMKALSNFYVEDLEEFVIKYDELIDCTS